MWLVQTICSPGFRAQPLLLAMLAPVLERSLRTLSRIASPGCSTSRNAPPQLVLVFCKPPLPSARLWPSCHTEKPDSSRALYPSCRPCFKPDMHLANFLIPLRLTVSTGPILTALFNMATCPHPSYTPGSPSPLPSSPFYFFQGTYELPRRDVVLWLTMFACYILPPPRRM